MAQTGLCGDCVLISGEIVLSILSLNAGGVRAVKYGVVRNFI